MKDSHERLLDMLVSWVGWTDWADDNMANRVSELYVEAGNLDPATDEAITNLKIKRSHNTLPFIC